MDNKFEFKGIQLFTQAQFSGITKDDSILYLVRTNEDKTDGYFWFNGKEYGTGADVRAAIEAKLGDLKDGQETFAAWITAIETKLGALPSGKGDTFAEWIAAIEEKTDTAVQSGSSANETYIKVSKSGTTLQVSAVTQTVASGSNGLADAKDVKDTLDATVAAMSAATVGEQGMYIESIKEENGVITAEAKDLPTYAIVSASSATTGYLKTYNLVKTVGSSTGITGTIDIPKDLVVKDGFSHKFETAVASGTTFTHGSYTITATEAYEVGDIAIILVVNTVAGEENQSFIQFKANNLIDIYTADNVTLKLEGNEFSAIMDTDGGVASHSALTALDAEVVKNVTVNGQNATVSGNTATVEIKGGDIKLSNNIDFSGATVASTADTVNAAFGQLGDAIAYRINQVDGRIDALDTDDIAVSGVTKDDDSAASGKTTDVLNDIYAKIKGMSASGITEITSQNITVTGSGSTRNLEVKKEAATETTVNAGHLEIKENTDHELYAVMYYGGNDAESTQS